MYNKNARVRDAPVDAPTDPAQYEEGVRKKFEAVVHALVSRVWCGGGLSCVMVVVD